MTFKKQPPSEPIKIVSSVIQPAETSLCDIVDATANIDDAIAQVTSQAVPTTASDQQEIFDQILVHQILASYPEKSWSDILPELQQLNLAPLTLEAIAANIEAPVALDLLLEQLNHENAVALLARCYIIAELDCVITEREHNIMTAIASKFNIDLKILENAVNAELTKNAPD
jgi:hypothetical protein